MVGGDVFAENVCSEGADTLLLGLELQIDADGLSEENEVLLLSQPGREPARFADPGSMEVNLLQAT
jgi:hypothetical protein